MRWETLEDALTVLETEEKEQSKKKKKQR